jgi:carbonic anhydrase
MTDGGCTVSVIDVFLSNNEQYAKAFEGPLPMPPSKRVAVVACMDARLDVYRVLGLGEGEAHVIRNAGGIVDDGTLRSLIISQYLLGTREIILIHHTDCGMLTFTDDALRARVKQEIGFAPAFTFGAFADPAEDVRSAKRRLLSDPYLQHRDAIRGFVFDVATGKLNPVAD